MNTSYLLCLYMHFINFNIHTDLVPKRLYELKDVNIIVYPSKVKYKYDSNIYIPRTLTGVIIIGSKETLTTEFLKQRIKDFIVYSNFIWSSKWSIIWHISNYFYQLEKKVQPINELNYFIQENHETDINNIEGFNKFHDIYDICAILPTSRSLKVDFQELFKNYLLLPERDKLKEQIALFALNGDSIALLNNFYDNSNLQISFLYAILDSLIKEKIDSNDSDGKKKKDKNRIEDFVSELNYSSEDKILLNRIIWEHYKVRNYFFHEVETVSLFDSVNQIIERTGNNEISIEDELNFGQGRLTGYNIVKEIVHRILIDKLKNGSQIEP